MRDPNRIPVVLEALKAYWEKHPDLRLGQLIWHIIDHSSATHDLFNVEEKDLLEGLEKLRTRLP